MENGVRNSTNEAPNSVGRITPREGSLWIDREETELENAAFILAQALVLWFSANQQETEAGEIDLSKSALETP